MTKNDSELDDLPDLPDLAELQDLPELPDELPELPDDLPELPDEAVAEVEPEPEAIPEAIPEPEPDPLTEEAEVSAVEEVLEADIEEELDPFELPAASAPEEPASESKPEPEPAAEPEDAPALREATLEPVAAPATPAPEPTPAAASTSASEPPALAPGEKPPLRELDKAPKHLRIAAQVAVLGTALPFMGKTESDTGDVWIMATVSKVVVVVAAWFWLQQVVFSWDSSKLKGALAKLGSLHLKLPGLAKKEKKKSRRQAGPTKLEHPFPTGLHLVSILLIVAAFVLAMQDGRQGMMGPKGVAEMGMLGWAAFTFVHIAAYERWGHFNPLFPLMFLAMLFSGIAAVVGGIGAQGLGMVSGVVGGGIVAASGGLAAYTIVEAMMHAKKEGDRKKAEALEARKAARKRKK